MAGMSDDFETAENWKEAGNEAMRKGKYSEAILNYKKGLKIEPRNAILNCNISQAYLAKKEFCEAEKYSKFAIEEQPSYVKGYYRAAKAALGRHCIYDAMLYLAEGAANCSGTPQCEDLYVMARDLSPEFENSLRRCQKAPSAKPSQPQTSQQKVEEDFDRQLDEKSKRKRDLEKKRELLKKQDKEVTDALERESRELEELAKKKKEQERLKKEKELQEKKEREVEAKKARELADKKAREMEEAKARELKLKKARELENSKKRAEEEKIQKELERITSLKDQIHNDSRDGSAALMKGFGRKAVDKLERALDTIRSHPADTENLGFSDPMDIVVLQYTYSQALIESGEYTDIMKGIKVLEGLELDKQHLKFPAILLLLGKAMLRLNRFKEALLPLKRGLAFIERGTPFPRFPWPGTHDVIDVTERQHLKAELESSAKVCGIYHKPDAVCFHQKCSTTSSQHIIPSRNIFFSDPDFNGFLTIVCSENCNIFFHLSCWKDFREHLSIEKLSEKDFLTKDCFTPDCGAVVVKLAITGPDGEVKSHCEHTISRAQAIEATSLPKSPNKKRRKKELEKDSKQDHSKKKRTRCDSKSQDFKTDNFTPKNNYSQGDSNIQYSDAIAKLIEARANNFGYHSVPDSLEVGDNPTISMPSHLNQNEEFIYSYFYEIFKKNGHMSVFALQEHWEANRELLPELEPALVTHTDLVKFLLDTDGFAVVQDMIGIASDLPKISAVVESKTEPLPAVDGWQFSAATIQEASQTLSFNSALPENYEEVDTRAEDLSKHDCDKSSSSSYHSISEDGNKEEESSCIDLDGSSNALFSSDHTFNLGKAAYVNGYNSTDHVNSEGSSDSSNNANVKPSLPPAVESSKAQSSNDLKPVNGKNRLSNLPVIGIELSDKMTNLKVNEETNNNCKVSNPVINDKTMQNHSSEQSSPRAAPAPWKPRAKLLKWACEAFPGEPERKLWDALTKVRAENNFTLSGLSFDAIREKVRSVLLVKST
ncbi:E3 ubiquitin-protein ligase TTC3-like [Thrips palmi]|uniref:E3 ubiquitin-protein ligase TTC3-like n=1 Tax=Thrips palmi TaxID=161013 RepID=A0A6P8YE38_THRPL|nr:E3 ubiquitin-protein ligase TTC3-like [Thrips palmi]XP_034237968.1 E3 ubiquitin-protein ligase TTC3-like [Thrips palmi]